MLRVIAVVTFGAGLAGLVTTVLASVLGTGDRPAWLEPILSIPLRLALTFLPAAVVSVSLMPSRADLAEHSEPGAERDLPLPFVLLLVALCGIATLDAGPLVAWWAENLNQVSAIYAFGPDPLGFNLIPTVGLISMPLLAGASMLSFVLTSTLVVGSQREFTVRVLAASVALQAGLVIGAYLMMDGLRDVGAMVAAWLTDEASRVGDHAAATQAATWFARQDALGSAVISRLLWIFGGYLVALGASRFIGRRAAPATTTAPSLPVGAGVGSASVAAGAVAPWTSSAFDRSTYGVRPATSLASVFRHRSNEYRIDAIPPSAAARFSYSWSSGIVRREADGASVLALRVHEHRWLHHPTYAVFDGVANVPLGLLQPNGHNWDVVSGAGQPLARIERRDVGLGYVRYVAAVAGVDLCRFTWTAGALAMASAELEIDFVPGTEHLLDRAFAIAAGPILEEQARRLMWRRNR